MFASLAHFFDSEGFMPHGMCLLWRPEIYWTHIAADAFIVLAYFSIPGALVYFARRRPDFPYIWMLYLFGAFIVWCGITHALSIWTLWVPEYGIEAAAKIVTAIVSVTTAIVLWQLMPKVISIPGVGALQEMNIQLRREINDRQSAEHRLQELTSSLERRVEDRTRELTEANGRLEYEVERRKRVETQLLSAIFETEEASRAKTVFLAGMSHELRSPLNSILGFSQLLQQTYPEGMSARQLGYVASIQTSGSLLLDLIERLLDLSMAESGRADIRVEPTDVSLCMQKARTVLEPIAQEAGVELVLNPADFEGMTAAADPTRLTQIFINLGTNAIKYNRPGGRVDVSVLAASLKDMTVRFTDTGIGIPDAYRDQVFQSFNRLNQDKSAVRGTGIGLALSKRFADAMGAALTFESIEGHGSVFDLTLKRA